MVYSYICIPHFFICRVRVKTAWFAAISVYHTFIICYVRVKAACFAAISAYLTSSSVMLG